MRKLLIFTVFIICVTVIAQDETRYPAITSDNMLYLASVQQVNFETDLYIPSLHENAQDEPLDAVIELGWFTYSQSSDRFLLLDNVNTLYGVASNGATTAWLEASDTIDAVPFAEEFFALLSSSSNGFSVRYDNFALYGGTSLVINVDSSAIPSAIWVTCPENNADCYASVEAFQDGETIIYTLPSFDGIAGDNLVLDIADSDLEQRSYLPASDEEAVVRIGRIPLPYVVTSSLEGIVKLWNLDTGHILYEVDNGTGDPSVFGNINADATDLVWRDNANQTLYLLNFETGENREIAPLNGDYAQWYFLSNDTSVIIAVNLGGEPNVVVWDTVTGDRTDLGNYRDCNRPQPDMTGLTEDGTTLIIGCDTGLDIWRISEED